MTPKLLGSIFGGLFGTAEEQEAYLRALEEASRWLAEEASSKPSNQKEKGWIN